MSIEGRVKSMFDLPIHVVRPFLGARVLKTGLSVFLAILLFHWIDPRFAVTAGIPAFLAVQPSVVRSGQTVKEQMLGNIVGAIIAATLGFWLGPTPITMALGVILTIVILPRLGLVNLVVQSVVMLLVVLDQEQFHIAVYSTLRIGSVFGGTLVGYLVNRFVLPPDFGRPFREAVVGASDQVDQFAQRIQKSLTDPEQYEREEIRRDREAIHQQLGKARLYLDLLREDRGDQDRALGAGESALAGLGVFAERLADLHRTARHAGGLTAEEEEITGAAVSAVMAYKVSMLNHVLLDGPLPEEAEAQVNDALGALDRLVIQLVATQPERDRGLHLHAMLGSIRHMFWQIQHVERPHPHSA